MMQSNAKFIVVVGRNVIFVLQEVRKNSRTDASNLAEVIGERSELSDICEQYEDH